MADSILRQLLKKNAPIVYNHVVSREAQLNNTPVTPVKIIPKLTEQDKFEKEAADFEKFMADEEEKRKLENSDTSSARINKPGGGTDYS